MKTYRIIVKALGSGLDPRTVCEVQASSPDTALAAARATYPTQIAAAYGCFSPTRTCVLRAIELP